MGIAIDPSRWALAVAAEPRASAPLRSAGRAVGGGDAAEDRALIARIVAGDREALGDLYDRYASALLGLALRILRSRADAEDLLNDVFLEAWERAATYKAERGTVRAWLTMRTRSRAIDRARSLAVARRHGMAPAADEAGFADVADPLPASDPALASDRRRARAALAALPAERRRVIECAYFGGLSCSEIAALDDVPIGTVKSRMRAGLRDLRAAFEAPLGPEDGEVKR